MAQSVTRRLNELALLAALSCFAQSALAEVNVFAAIIDPNAEDRGFEAIEAFVGALPEFPAVVGIDLTVKHPVDGPLGINLVRVAGAEPEALDCDEGFGRVAGGYAEISIDILSVYTHWSPHIALNALTGADGLVLSCIAGADGRADFRLMGHFVVSRTAIPTAWDTLFSAVPVR